MSNWNVVLSSTRNLNDVLIVLQKVLALLQNKADVTTIDEALDSLATLDQQAADSIREMTNRLNQFGNDADTATNEAIMRATVRGFATEQILKQWTPDFDGARAKADDTKKIWRWELTSAAGITPITGNWVDTGLSEKDQALQEVNANTFYNPKLLTEQDNLDLIEAGTYYIRSAVIATATNAPISEAGHLIATKSSTGVYVGQTYISASGLTFHRSKNSGTWSVWGGKYSRNLSSSDNLNNLVKSGTYFSGSGGAATAANNHPFAGVGCIVIVENFGTYVRQQVLSQIGSAQRSALITDNTYTWSAWSGTKYKDGQIFDPVSDVDLIAKNIFDSKISLNLYATPFVLATSSDISALTEGIFHVNSSAIATAVGLPIAESGTLICTKSGTGVYATQTYMSKSGCLYQRQRVSGAWSAWAGSRRAALSTNSDLNTFVDNGVFFSGSGGAATAANNHPFIGKGGILLVETSTTWVRQQMLSIAGVAQRQATIANGVYTWSAWTGIKYVENSIIDLAYQNETKTKLITFGSSTLWYLTDEMQELANRKNMILKANATSGYTLGAAGLNQGTNKMTVQFESGVITTGTNTVIIESSFNDDIRAAMIVELSNGVKGSLNYRDKTFTPSNLTTSLTVSSTEKYKVLVPEWNDVGAGVYIFNIGKNSVSSSIDNSDYIIEKTVEMIEAIPQGSKFIVGGHFSNWVGTTTEMHHTVVHSVNQKLRLKYGLKYFDIAELFNLESTWTTLGLTKTTDDIAAIAANRMPPSLSRDAAHMSAGMDLIAAKVIEDKLIFLGYI